MSEHLKAFLPRAVLLAACLLPPAAASGDEPVREGGWLTQRDEQAGIMVRTMDMTLHPRDEPRPAMKYRLVPDDFDMIDGNAAVYYLKASGFFEQQEALERIRDIYKKANQRAETEKTSSSQVPPMQWLSMAPGQLPLDEVKEFLRLTSFQVPLLAEAARRRQLDLDRNLPDIENVLGYLLPEVQSMRELARLQALRCKVAIAEGQIDQAIAILGQQYALARHLGQDDFLITNLVGLACAGIAWDDALYLVQHPDAPNLYWAMASLPRPLVDIRRSLTVERQLLSLQFKVLREVDETLRPAGYWRDFLDRMIHQFGGMEREFGLPALSKDPDVDRAALVAFIAAAYPGAKRYLIEDCGLPPDRVADYPTAQVVFLAVVRYYEETRDEMFKWSHLPYWQAEGKRKDIRADDLLAVKAKRVGLIAAPARALLPAVSAAQAAVVRCEQGLALVQTVEAIRMYGAVHGGRLPATLDDLPVPAPPDPVSGKAFDYQCHGDHAVLSGRKLPGIHSRLVLRFAAP